MLKTLEKMKSAYAEAVAKELHVPEVTVVQWARSFADQGLVTLGESVAETVVLTEEGKKYAAEGLPERQILASIHGPTLVEVLAKHPLARIGVGWALKKNWITNDKGIVAAVDNPPEGEDEAALKHPDARTAGCKELVKRGLAEITKTVSWKISITPAGEEVAKAGPPEGVGTLSREQILSGEWRGLSLRRYSVYKRPKKIFGGRVHPNQQILDEIRALLFEMGFTELYGSIVQSAFWNFDSLYQPQDHPAREMQDTFHLAEEMGLPEGWEKIRDIHRTGGNTGSTGWGGEWSPEVARKCVLRTHSTSLSIQYLSTHPTPPVKAFSISRVYRRETIDPTHLPEFEQLEGIVMDKGLTFGHLLGFLKEFFERLGFDSVRFRPGYFPYTEPSVEPEVWVDGLGWVELGGAGVFRKEVTAPWGIDCPVLAWGLGESRVSMLRMGLKDIRQLYHSDIDWIRATPVRRV
ncbi:MAG TPA: phenylalanine--tRNA ligase subunit alpha [Methanocorpusculum sp.]|nr:phenylalanine--tRNA ligase subunit alpha [Methanocorpusculum sp.]